MKRPHGPKSLGWRRCEGQKLKGAVLAEVRTFQRVGSHVAVRNPTQAPRLPGSVFTRLADELSVAPLLHGTTDRLSEELAAKKKKNSLASHQAGFHLRFVHERPRDWRQPALSYQRELQAKVQVCSDAVRLRRAQIVCSAAALASSLFIGVDQSRLFTIWVITHHAHLMELALFYIF